MQALTLQTLRNLEYFLFRIGVLNPEITDSMSFDMRNHTLYIAVVDRTVSVTVTINRIAESIDFENMFDHFSPGQTFGYVMKLVRTVDHLGINFVLTDNSYSEIYLQLYRLQNRFVEMYLNQRF